MHSEIHQRHLCTHLSAGNLYTSFLTLKRKHLKVFGYKCEYLPYDTYTNFSCLLTFLFLASSSFTLQQDLAVKMDVFWEKLEINDNGKKEYLGPEQERRAVGKWCWRRIMRKLNRYIYRNTKYFFSCIYLSLPITLFEEQKPLIPRFVFLVLHWISRTAKTNQIKN